MLLNREVEKILDELKCLQEKYNETEKLIDYYQANKTRMNYPLYKKQVAPLLDPGLQNQPTGLWYKKD